jgi:hypothetical protein
MSAYNAFVVPLSDAMKWFNYRAADIGSVKQSVERALGKNGKAWFINFVKDLNGISSKPYSTGLSDMMIRNAKIASVAANLSVVIQQPVSYLRAAAVISPKYLISAVFHKSNVAMAKKYAPIAQWKSWGFYDVNIGKSLREVIVGDESTAQKIRQVSLAGAQIADNLTWGALWNACEAEIRDTRRDLKPGTEAFNNAVGERLSEIVDRTQVVDSVFHRSQLMRSENSLVKLYTAFMAEPTKSYNLLRNAIAAMVRNDPGAKAKFARVVVTFAVTQIANAAVRAIVGAFRDDDDEEEFMEKWLQSFTTEAIDNINPLNLIPGLREVMSILEGYDASRMDLKAVEDMVATVNAWIKYANGESRWSVYKLIFKSVQAVSSLTGIPAGNLMRAFNSVYNTLSGENIDMENETATITKSYETLYDAILSGDTATVERIRALMAADEESPKSPEDIDKGIAEVLMQNDPRIKEAYEARTAGKFTLLRSIYAEIRADGFTDDMITYAVNAYKNSLKEDEAKDLTEELDVSMYDYDDLYVAIRGGTSNSDLQEIAAEIMAHSDAQDPEQAVRDELSAEFKNEYVGYVEDGNTAQAETLAENLMIFGFTEDKLAEWVSDYQYEQIRAAVESYDADTANEYINEKKEAGAEDSDIASSITRIMKAKVIAFYEEGDYDGIQGVIDFLTMLELYYTNENYYLYGYSYYYEDKIWGWIEDYEESLAEG